MRNKAEPISGEEVCRISQMLWDGMDMPTIHKATGRSLSVIQRIKGGLGYTKKPIEVQMEAETNLWLTENWSRIDIDKSFKLKTNFRSMYHPRGWGQ